MANVYEEVLRIVLETQGEKGLDALRQALANVSDVSEETLADTTRLVDALGDLNAAAAKATRFQQLTDELERTTQALDHASREAIQLNLELKETDNPSKTATAAYKRLRDEVEKLEAKQKSQTALQEKLGKELRESGLDTVQLADANRVLRGRLDDTTNALKRQTTVVEQEAAATRKQRDALEETQREFRAFVAAGDASAAALKRFRDGAESSAAATSRLASEGGRLQGMFSGLRGLIGPVLAYLSFDSAIRGIQNLAGVAAGAEDARRALVNLYGSTQAGERAYEGLRTMAKNAGLAFGDLVNDAKKLKAFGLDPLNGSLQALIDQNAAVGGSQQDLSGKVLALGQAWAKQKLQGEEILQLVERGVPVWSLLEKVTGRNVQELQKLSEQGKLGRDVIKKLYEELGRANTGAAERGLSSLSGLMAQLRARWESFLQLVADNGVTEYFKQRMASLLGATGSLDQLAKRVAESIIGMLEGLRNLGAALAPIGAAIGNLTLFLARHAEAIVNVAKAWAVFRAIEIAAGFGKIAQAVVASTTALVAQNAALAGTAAAGNAVGGLSGLFAALGTRIAGAATAAINLVRVLGIPAAVATGVYALAQAYEGVIEANNKLWQSEARMRAQQQDQLRMGQLLQQMYRDNGTVAIESVDAVSQKTRDQANDYKFALEQARLYYKGVINEAVATGDALALASGKERFEALGVAITGVTEHLEKLKQAADPRGLQAFADAAVTKFDELVTKSKDAKTAISGIFDGLDFRSADGIRQASDILVQVAARGTDAGRAIKTELAGAIAKVAVEDLPKLKAQAEAAMAAGVVGAKEFGSAIASVNLTRLGVDIEAIKTGFTAVGKSAVEAFRGAIKEVDDLGLTVQQRSQAIAQAFDNAFKQASTKAELASLKAAIQDALASGDIGFAEFQARVAETDAKLAALSGTGAKMGADVASGAQQATSALSGMSSAANSAASNVGKVGAAAESAGDGAARAKPELQSFALGLGNISKAATDALLATNKIQLQFKGMTSGGFGHHWTEAVNNITRAIRQQQAAVDGLIDSLNQQNTAYDENAKRLIELRRQYAYLADSELQRLIDAENTLRDNRAAADEEARQANAQRTAEYQAQASAAADAAKQAAESGSVLTGRSNQGAQATATAAKEVLAGATAAAGAISEAAKTLTASEVVLRVIAEPSPAGQTFVLSTQQLNDITAAVVRALSLSKGSSN